DDPRPVQVVPAGYRFPERRLLPDDGQDERVARRGGGTLVPPRPVPAAAAEGTGARDAEGGVDSARAARVRARGGVRHSPGHVGGPRTASHRLGGRLDLEVDGALGGVAAP